MHGKPTQLSTQLVRRMAIVIARRPYGETPMNWRSSPEPAPGWPALAQGLADERHDVLVADIDGTPRGDRPAGRRAACRPHPRPGGASPAGAARGRGRRPHVLINNAGGWTPGDEQTRTRRRTPGPHDDAEPDRADAAQPAGAGTMRHARRRRDRQHRVQAGAESSGYGSPEYGSTKAGLIRLTSSLAGPEESHGPDDLHRAELDRSRSGHAQFAALPPEVRARRRR